MTLSETKAKTFKPSVKTRIEKPEIKPEKPKAESLNDLCSTCSASQGCIYHTRGKAVHYCEEYDLHEPLSEPVTFIQPEIQISRKGLTGLCVTCVHRDSCINARTIGGIWHCEEFE
ncbi:MAG TPA: hypothetical protein VGB30_08840 [bacterium]